MGERTRLSPLFTKCENGGREPGFFSPQFRFLEFGRGRRGFFVDLEHHYFHFKIPGNN